MGSEVVKTYLYMDEDSLVTKIMVCNDGKIYFENISNNPLDCAFGLKSSPVSLGVFYDFLEERCFPRSRFNRDEVLEGLGLEVYDPLDIVEKTYGLMIDDTFWIKKEEDTSTYKDVLAKVGFDKWKKRRKPLG